MNSSFALDLDGIYVALARIRIFSPGLQRLDYSPRPWLPPGRCTFGNANSAISTQRHNLGT